MRLIDAHRVENLLQMCGSYHGVIAYDTVISILHDVPTIDAPQWISVTERLPEEKTYVLILADTIAGKMVKVSFIYKDSAGRNCWTTLDEYGKNLFDWQPTHWMPLPEPWKGESDGN